MSEYASGHSDEFYQIKSLQREVESLKAQLAATKSHEDDLSRALHEALRQRDDKDRKLIFANAKASRAIPGVPEGMTSGSRPPAMNAQNLRLMAIRCEGHGITAGDIRHLRQWADYIEEWDRRPRASSEPLASPGNEKESAQPVRHGEEKVHG